MKEIKLSYATLVPCERLNEVLLIAKALGAELPESWWAKQSDYIITHCPCCEHEEIVYKPMTEELPIIVTVYIYGVNSEDIGKIFKTNGLEFYIFSRERAICFTPIGYSAYEEESFSFSTYAFSTVGTYIDDWYDYFIKDNELVIDFTDFIGYPPGMEV